MTGKARALYSSMIKLLLTLLLCQCRFTFASFLKYGILVENGAEDDHDYVELGEIWAKDTTIADKLEVKLNEELMVDFLLSTSRVLRCEDVYELGALVKKSKIHARWLTVYELDGEIAMLANYIAFMISKLQEPKTLILKEIEPVPIMFRKDPEPLLEATKISLYYIKLVVGYDLVAAKRSMSTKKQGKVHNGYELLLDEESNVVDYNVCCNGCIIS